ncbi:unnamed protein product [Clavelina lepadiformis]|uniref:Cytochrome P450 n=1 Tax=Clavelina lepadiformis TaxID=159417 RepID=A0ABP0GWN5_CLALP
MLDFTSAALFLATFLGVYYWFWRPKKFPPGPRGIPILGVVPFLGKWPERVIQGWCKKYGPVVSVRMGREDWVVLNDFESLNQCFVKQHTKFSGRPYFEALDNLTHGLGLTFSDYGPLWKSQRKFGQKTLRGFGVGRKGMENSVTEEVTCFLKSVQATEGKAFDIKDLLQQSSCNVISSIVMGKRYEYNDDTLRRLVKIFSDVFDGAFENFALQAIMFAPKLIHVYPISRFYEELKQNFKYLSDISSEAITEHEKTFDKENPRDFIDAFLNDMKEGSDKSFKVEQLRGYLRDIFEAGTETTSSTINWSLICLLHYPEIQTKLREEIRKVVGLSSTVKMSHRRDMPYMNAFIQEIMRFRTFTPFAFHHKTSQDAEINGYFIPKDTTVLPNIWAVHNDPNYWNEPEKFKPERFIDEKGNFFKSEHVIPFSVGPRHCLGEQLARMEIFIFLVSMIQRFEFLPDPESKFPELNDGSNGSLFIPYPYKLICQEI